jgi:hypothetical protein
MPIEFRDLRPEYPVVEIVVEGSFTYPESAEVMREGTAYQRAEGILLLLIDATGIIQPTPPAGIIELAENVAEMGAPPGWKQAFLRPTDLFAAMSADMWEASAQNRGLNVKAFKDRDQALAWLLADTDDK